MRLSRPGVVRTLAAVMVAAASASSPSVPLGAAGHGRDKLDPLLQGRQLAAPGRSQVVLRLASADAVAGVASLARSYGGKVIRRLPIVDSVALDLPNTALPMIAGDAPRRRDLGGSASSSARWIAPAPHDWRRRPCATSSGTTARASESP